MPSKAKKKRKNQASFTDKILCAVPPPHDLDTQAAELAKEWDGSPQKEDLVKQVREIILSHASVFVDEALCLGLGSMEMAKLGPLPGRTETTFRAKGETSVEKPRWTKPSKAEESSFAPVALGCNRNKNLYQLLIFETALSCLRTRPSWVSLLPY